MIFGDVISLLHGDISFHFAKLLDMMARTIFPDALLQYSFCPYSQKGQLAGRFLSRHVACIARLIRKEGCPIIMKGPEFFSHSFVIEQQGSRLDALPVLGLRLIRVRKGGVERPAGHVRSRVEALDQQYLVRLLPVLEVPPVPGTWPYRP